MEIFLSASPVLDILHGSQDLILPTTLQRECKLKSNPQAIPPKCP